MSDNLWGTLPGVENLRVPATILREQGSVLAELTNSVLEGHVDFSRDVGRFVLKLSIYAKALNYMARIVVLRHDVELYPVEVETALYDSPNVTCADESELLHTLREILSSERVHRLIAALLVQTKAITS